VTHLLTQRPRRWQTIETETVAYLFRSLRVCYSLFFIASWVDCKKSISPAQICFRSVECIFVTWCTPIQPCHVQ